MGVAKSVFASRAERANFQKLQSRWGDRYDLWHNLPFLNLFTREDLIDPDSADLRSLTISDIEWQRLKKTSVDYVLCDREHDAPLICIDFDGIQDGFNAGREYRPRAENPSPWRDVITSLKLKVAHGSLFPYFVVGWREFADISPTIRRSVVDGIIGEVLAKQAVSDRFARGLTAADAGMTEAEWEALPPWDQGDIIEHIAMTIEIDADFEHNPLYADVAKLCSELGYPAGSHRFVDAPGTTRAPSGQWLEETLLFGVEYTLRTDDVGTVKRTAWLPNFRAPGFIGLGLVEEIAHLLALDEVGRLREKQRRTH
jgi:hypothetical protein